MTKIEILEEIKKYNKTMLQLRIKEQANEHETNFDRQNVVAEQIDIARESEREEIEKTLKNYLSNKGVIAIGENMLDYCSITDMIYACNTID